MPNVIYPCTSIWRDCKGLTGAVKWYLNEALLATAQADTLNVFGLIDAITNAGVVNVRGPGPHAMGTLNYGTAAQYADIEDKALLLFEDAAGKYHRYLIPAPIEAMFLADGITIDKTQAAMASLITGWTVTYPVCGIDGSILTTYIGGWLRRKRLRRRYNLLTLDPTLTVPAI